MVRIRFPPAASQQRTVPALAPIARRGAGETIRAVLFCADLRDFTAQSEATEPAAMIATLDADASQNGWALLLV